MSGAFDRIQDVPISPTQTFRVYQVLAEEPVKSSEEQPTGVLFVMHHGAGYTGLTWSCMVKKMRSIAKKPFAILCFDCRGHGATSTDDELNLSLATLTDDLSTLIKTVYGKTPSYEIILVGHSLGGAVVVEAAAKQIVPSLLGVIVIDVVEGTAIESLPHMEAIIKGRPSSFRNEKEAIEWALGTSQIRNRESAQISLPSQLRREGDTFQWRTDLLMTKPYWNDWFKDLSTKFLSVKCARLLILANTERLDKTLTIGQIQGKFQLLILNQVGHLIHEDKPDEIADALIRFWERNGRMNLPPMIRCKINRVQ